MIVETVEFEAMEAVSYSAASSNIAAPMNGPAAEVEKEGGKERRGGASCCCGGEFIVKMMLLTL
jgi:hypothetical protein